VKAAVLHGARDLRVLDMPDPASPGPGEVTIGVTRCGICGTDAHEYASGGPMTPLREAHPWSGHAGPTIIGHEFTGVIVQAGQGTGELIPGVRVVAGAGRWCGECDPCVAGRTNLCARYYTYGLSTHGGMAEFVTVPVAMCVAVPDACSDARAVLAQPVAIALHAIDRADPPPGSEVLVLGAGGIGALIVAAAAECGLRVLVADLDPARLDAAVALGAEATHLIDPAEPVLPFRGLATVIEASGSGGGLGLALSATRPGGRVVGVGLPGRPVEFDLRQAVVAEIDLVTSSAHVCRRDLPRAVKLLTGRPVDEVVVDRVVTLSELVPQGLEPMAAGQARGKVVVTLGPHIGAGNTSGTVARKVSS
jgi:(R,R)-butanediol dehydrogenase/meso-butanediol dehydrogenase/diacetyl reductase